MIDVVDIHWVDDIAGVSELAEIGLHPFGMVIPVASINIKASSENRARKIPLDKDRLPGIRSSFERSIPMPKIFVRKMEAGDFVIVGGNHRFHSLPSGVKSIPVHVLECTDSEFTLACIVLNNSVGDGNTKEDRVNAAVDACERLGVNQKHAARIFGTTQSAIQESIRYRNYKAKLAALPLKTQAAMTYSHIRSLGDLAKNDNVLRAACVAASSTKATVVALAELAREARELPTEAAQVQVFEKHAKLNEVEPERAVPKKLRSSFLKSCTALKNLKDIKTWQGLEFDADQISEAKKTTREVIDYLSCLCQENG
jgi:ParB-like chromosome segregation protein Spo0J